MHNYLKDGLKAALKVHVVSVELTRGDDILVIPYTLRKDLISGEIPDTGDITMFNTIAKKYECINPDTIRQYQCVFLRAREDNTPGPDEAQPEVLREIEQIRETLKKLKMPKKFNKLMSSEVQYHSHRTDVMTLMKMFDCDLESLTKGDAEFLEAARAKYMEIIRENREQAFKELDQLEEEAKKEGSTQEDLDDIDTIKQMFRDIPQDTDLSQYKTIKELIGFWPSLLLPSPMKLTEASWLSPTPTPTPQDQLSSILESIDVVEELEELLKQVEKTKTVPEYAIKLLNKRITELKTG